MGEPFSAAELDALQEVAGKATQKRWQIGFDDGSGVKELDIISVDGEEETIVSGTLSCFGTPYGISTREDAEHIAAFDPPTALRLVEMAREAGALRATVARLVEAMGEEWPEGDCPECDDIQTHAGDCTRGQFFAALNESTEVKP